MRRREEKQGKERGGEGRRRKNKGEGNGEEMFCKLKAGGEENKPKERRQVRMLV